MSVFADNNPSPRIQFEVPDSYPEGIAYDNSTDVFYVSSVRTATVGKVNRQGVYNIVYADTLLKSTYGMKVHPDGKHLFVCAADATYSKYSTPQTKQKMAKLISIDLASRQKNMEVDLSNLLPGKHFSNDLTFDDKGNIYVTDSYANAIYKITPNGVATVFAKDKQFETEGIGLNGIVFHPNGFLLVNSSNLGTLFKIDIKNPSNIQKVKTEQFFLGADGMILNDNNKLTIVVNGGINRIFQLTTKDNWQTAKAAMATATMDRFANPSTATTANDGIWVINAKANELKDSSTVPSIKFDIQLAEFKSISKE